MAASKFIPAALSLSPGKAENPGFDGNADIYGIGMTLIPLFLYALGLPMRY